MARHPIPPKASVLNNRDSRIVRRMPESDWKREVMSPREIAVRIPLVRQKKDNHEKTA